jgi:hypothetical protein
MTIESIIDKHKHKVDELRIELRKVDPKYPDVVGIFPYIRIGNIVCDKPLYVCGKGSTEELYHISDEYITEILEKLKNYKGE